MCSFPAFQNRHAGITHDLMTFPFNFCDIFLSAVFPSVSLHAPACIWRCSPTSEYPSQVAIPQRRNLRAVAAGWTRLPGGFAGAAWRTNDFLAFRRRADGRGRQGISHAQSYYVLFALRNSGKWPNQRLICDYGIARWTAVAQRQSVGSRCEIKVVVFGLRVYKSY